MGVMTTDGSVSAPRLPLLHRLAPVVGLMILSPIAAEYLIGYDDIIDKPLELVGGLVVFSPLYGTVAVLIREAVRRTGRGWPSMLLLGLAFGIIQAGLIDQSLFNTHYRNIPAILDAQTLIPGLGFSASMALNFTVGHMIWSFGAPIAVVEACVPSRACRPWLGWAGLTVVAVLYAVAAVYVFYDQMNTEHFLAPPAHLVGAAALAMLLTVAAFRIPPRSTGAPGWVPPPWLVAGGAAGALLIHQTVRSEWPAVAIDVVVLSLLGGLTLYWSRRAAWGRRHVLALAGAALLVNAWLSFFVEPLGTPDLALKYSVNAALSMGVLTLLAFAFRRLRSAPPARTCRSRQPA
jgi:hypothetical protein